MSGIMGTRSSSTSALRLACCAGAALLAFHAAGCSKSADATHAGARTLAELRRAAEADPDSVGARGRLALALQANDRPGEAAPLYERLCVDDAHDGRWPYYLARIRQDEGDNARALALLEESRRRAPEFALIELRRAELLFKSGEPAQAEAAYRRYVDRVPTGVHGWLGLARVALQRRAWSEAEAHLRAAISADPTLGTSYALLAGVHDVRGETEKGARARARAEAAPRFREPDDPWLEAMLEMCRDVEKLCVLGDIAVETGRVARGIGWLRRAVAIDPQRARTRLALGKALLLAGERAAGEAELRNAIRLEPKFAEAHHAWIAALMEDGDATRALAAADHAVAQAPSSAALHRQRGIVLQRLGRSDDAEAALRRAVAIDAGDVQNVEALGNHLWASGRQADAASQFERARSLSRLAVKPRALLAGYHLEAGNMTAAAACLREIVEVEPELEGLADLQALFHLRRGNALFRARELAAAADAFEAALSARAENEEAWTGLAAVLQRTGRAEEARARLDALLRANPDAVFGYALAARVALQTGDRGRGLDYLDRGLAAARAQSDNRRETELLALRARVR